MEKLSYDCFVRQLAQAAAQIEAAKEELTELDCKIGDGDHGTTMTKVTEKIKETALARQEKDFHGLLSEAGNAVMQLGGGATVALFGAFFSGMARAVPEGKKELSKMELAEAFKAGEARLLKFSKAPPGAKTLVDALSPAIEAFASCPGEELKRAFEAAAFAAHEGSMKTKDYVARFGRAKNLGEKAIGICDPGSVSVSVIFRAYAEAVREEK